MSPPPRVNPDMTNAQIQAMLTPLFNATTMPTCHKLHQLKPCDVDWRLWAMDFYHPAANNNYDSQYESQSDATERLGLEEESDNGSRFRSSQELPIGPWYPSSVPNTSDAAGPSSQRY